MSLTQHTPGLWTIGPRREIFGQAFDSSARQICDKVRGGSPEAADANARLIAAAPELYKACRDYMDWLERVPDRECVIAVIENMRAAIAKVEGR